MKSSPRAPAYRSLTSYQSASAAPEPVASTSKVPYSPPAAVRLPNELLGPIFALARPPLPAASSRAEPLPPAWQAWAALPLVHSRWHPVAREALAKVVILRSTRQVKRFIDALKDGALGGRVDEILLDLKEAQCGTGEGGAASDAKSSAYEALLLEVLERCGTTLKALRWRGFGDPALANLSPALNAHLRRLEVFEYSPADASHPPTTNGLMSDLASLPALKELVVRPTARALTPLSHAPSEVLDALVILLQFISDLIATDDPSGMRDTYVQGVAGVGLNQLETLALHSLVLTPLSLFGILFPSFCTLRHLRLSSLVVLGSPVTLANTLMAVAPGLESFEWSEGPIVGRAGGLNPPLSDEQYWGVVRRLTSVRQLKLFGPQVFAPSPHKAGFALPSRLEQLTLGSCDEELEVEELEWWLERVDELCAAKEGGGEAATAHEGVTAQEPEEEERSEGDDSGVGLLDTAGEKSAASDDGASTCSSASSYTSAASVISSAAGADTGTASPTSTRALSDDPPPLAHLTPASTPASSPSPGPSPSLSPAPPASPARTASPSQPSPPRPRRKRRTLSWSHPPLPPSGLAPQLSHLTLCTAASPLRAHPQLVRRVDALVAERGVAVEWFRLVVVVLETVELTREIRAEMSEVGEGWA
ncbi:hypothetical protein JCM10450v2_003586 [Rhodotorula kratochvilovae]